MPATLKFPVFDEIEIKKSRFLAWVEPVQSPEDAKSRIETLRQQYSDARHVCSAFYVQGASGLSDDGEPSGTAAKPMFNVLNHKDLINVVAVVVRYFGGIKLGAGGLSRAYGGSVSKALLQAEYQVVERMWTLQLHLPFSLEGGVRRVCMAHQVTIDNVAYRQEVDMVVLVSDSIKDTLLAALLSIAPADEGYRVQIVNASD